MRLVFAEEKKLMYLMRLFDEELTSNTSIENQTRLARGVIKIIG